MHTPSIIIAGGGIAGLAAALALGHREATIFEQAREFSEAGAGLQLGPNAVRALQKLGAWDAVEPITSSPPEIHMRDAVSGKILKRLRLGKSFEQNFGAPYRVAHRTDLHLALLSVVKSRPSIQTQLETAVSSVESHLSGVSFVAAGQALNCQAMIGADGVNSKVRRCLFSDTSAVDSGEIYHRAMIEAPTISSVDFQCVNLWMYPAGHVVHYPVGKNQRLNLVAITPKSTNALQYFQRATPRLRELLNIAMPHANEWAGLYAPQLQNWVKGGVILLGDAAHATLPYLAQGAAMSLEDAACLAAVLPTTQNLKHAFLETAQRRMTRTSRLQSESLSTGKIYHLGGAMRQARNLSLQMLPDAFVHSKLSWIYRHQS